MPQSSTQALTSRKKLFMVRAIIRLEIHTDKIIEISPNVAANRLFSGVRASEARPFR